MSQRRANRSTANSSTSGPPQSEEVDPNLEGAINECVRYIVCRESSKITLKRSELAKHLATVTQTAPNQVNTCIIEANKILKQVYGYKLVQVEGKSGIQYIVVLNEECESLPSTATDPNHRRILVAALLHIFMSGGPVKEDEMWKFLSEAGLIEEDDHSSRKILTHLFTRQMYLQFTKDGEGELARNVFEWGQRATEEVPKIFLLNKMAEAFDKTPDYWCEQYREATETEREA